MCSGSVDIEAICISLLVLFITSELPAMPSRMLLCTPRSADAVSTASMSSKSLKSSPMRTTPSSGISSSMIAMMLLEPIVALRLSRISDDAFAITMSSSWNPAVERRWRVGHATAEPWPAMREILSVMPLPRENARSLKSTPPDKGCDACDGYSIEIFGFSHHWDRCV